MVADAINREHHEVGLAGETGEQVQVVLDAAIVVHEAGIPAFCGRAQLRDMMRAAAHIKQGNPIQPRT